MVSMWWCNQGKIRDESYEGLILWNYERHHSVVCSQYDRSKNVNKYREAVGRVKKGDVIVHYVSARNQHILAISRARTDGREHTGKILTLPGHKSLEYNYDDDDNTHPRGWEFDTEYHDFAEGGIHLSQTLKRQIFELDLLDNPIGQKRNGSFVVRRPGYFRPFTLEGLRLIYRAAENKEEWPDWEEWE
jgi:hypothetical protein